MASTFMQHYNRCVPRLKAREKRYRDERLALSEQRLNELVEQIRPIDRKAMDEALVDMERERITSEHFDHYTQLVAHHQQDFKARVQQARTARTH